MFGFPYAHSKRIGGDVVYCVDPVTSEIRWESQRALPVRGSWESSVHVRSDREGTHWLWIDGNPAKFLQGHNLFGSDDLPSLLSIFSGAVVERLGLPWDPEDAHQVGKGSLARVDVTGMYQVGNTAQVRSFLQAADQGATLSHRGRGQLTREGTLYWGKHSKRWALKMYCKADELQAHGLPETLLFPEELDDLKAFAEGKLRVEVVLRTLELKRLGLDTVGAWEPGTAERLFSEKLSGLHLPGAYRVAGEDVEQLAPRLRAAYLVWAQGEDLRAVYPRRSFYRYRAELLKHGIDIAVRAPSPERSNVVPLVRILEATAVGVPGWAIGTRLYVDPRRSVA